MGNVSKRYRGRMRSGQVAGHVAALPRPSSLDQYEGLWVALVGDQVVAAANSSHALAMDLHKMDHRKRAKAVVEYVRPTGDSYIVGVG